MLNKRFVDKVAKFAADNGLLVKSGGKYIVALSGGADSVALALTLLELRYDVEAAHCNFRLRGAESDRDEAFCTAFCKNNGIPLHVAHFDTREFAALRKVSIEMAARSLRYAWFARLRTDVGAEAICVAHHKDDSVETVLMNLIRGTGIHGLTGIKPRNGNVERPLLCVGRCDIENVLAEIGQTFVTDSTNLETEAVRNKIRLELLPMMRRINPSVSDAVAATAGRLAEVSSVVDTMMSDSITRILGQCHGDRLVFTAKQIEELPAPGTTLFTLLSKFSFTSAQIGQIRRAANGATGKTFYSSTHRLLADRGTIIIEPLDDDYTRPMAMPEDGLYVYGGDTRLRVETIRRDEHFKLLKSKNIFYADASTVSFPLTVRRTERGDRFIPFGMKGSKLVSDYLTDIKMNLFDKRRQLVVTSADGRIIWLVNQRPDNRCRLTSETKFVLKITYEHAGK